MLMLPLDLALVLVHVDGVEAYSGRKAVEVQHSTWLREMVEIQRQIENPSLFLGRLCGAGSKLRLLLKD